MKNALRLIGAVLIVLGLATAGLALLTGPGAVHGELDHETQVKERVITGVYKVYGVLDPPVPMWLAKTVFRNGANSRITDLKVRYRVKGYADWSSWSHYPAVDPTQTVVDVYHPLFSARCAKLTTRAPAELEMECEYIDPSGKKREFTEARRITMLSRNEFVFSDLTAEERTGAFADKDTLSTLLAAWVSQNDEPVARLASLANKQAGGLGASSSDENAIKVMQSLYDIMREIHISYQHPQAMADPNMSYDLKLVQSLQYPRETIEKRSGTCIDLAILYAALMNSVNITPFLVSMDGHCFPLARLPSGNLLPVEATGVGDGYEKSMSFEQAVETATKTWKKINQTGRFSVINVRDAWMNGVSNPELDPLPADILEKWGIIDLVGGRGIRKAHRRESPRSPRTPPPRRVTEFQIAGTWAYRVALPDGRSVTGQAQISGRGSSVQLTAVAAYQAPGPDGMIHKVQEQSLFVGVLNGSRFTGRCTSAQVNVDGFPTPPQGLP